MGTPTTPAPATPALLLHPHPRKKYIAARAFYLTIALICLLTAWSAVLSRGQEQVAARDDWTLLRRGQAGTEKSLSVPVRIAKRDQAVGEPTEYHVEYANTNAIKSNCPDEEAGLFSYLQLYYCKLPKAKPVAFIIMVTWLGLLFTAIGIAASDFFCINLSTIASILGLSESITGVTFLAFGNGSGDIFSTFAAMKTHSGSLAVGELIGAASFITTVVAGSMALVRPFKVARRSFVRDVGFFIVAAGFSMVFLADGSLHLWECIAMVAFYIFYVVFVVIWHWSLKRRAKQRNLEDTARSHYHIPGTDEGAVEPYRDEEGEEVRPSRSRATTRTVSMEDFATLERAGSPIPKAIAEEIDASDETRDRYLAEISSNMRVSRVRAGERRNTINPIRPSLVGALEFTAILSSLQRSRNIQTMPINLRRYSDDPTFTAAQQQDNMSVVSNPERAHDDVDSHDLASNSGRSSQEIDRNGPLRVRAVSANDALGMRRDPEAFRKPQPEVPQVDFLSPSPPNSGKVPPPGVSEAEDGPSKDPPRLSLSPFTADQSDLVSSPSSLTPQDRRRSMDLLAPPGDSQNLPSVHHSTTSLDHSSKPHAPKLDIPRSPASSPRGTPLSPFPEYHDDPNFLPSLSRSRTPSIRLPPPSLGSESTFRQDIFQESEKPLRWWPYRILPSPQILLSTIFPTLYNWKQKSIWEKMLGVVAAPSVFLLVITLPTVEAEKDDDLPDIVDPDPGLLSPDKSHSRKKPHVPVVSESPEQLPLRDPQTHRSRKYTNGNNLAVSPSINVTAPEPLDIPAPRLNKPTQDNTHAASDSEASSPKAWNRWLIATQLFTGPWLIVLLIWANISPSNPRALLLPTLYSLLASLIALSLLLLFTSPTRPPRYRYLLCYLGFVIAIAWISTIANEVVGVLKAFGTILSISDAILGLTIFAVGNSCGDLVADITVARLGYPVMALSACFGGPMLNILLGIGLSGLYMTVRGAENRERKHPGEPLRYKPYQIEVGGTLLISGVTLLVTLAGLLIVVPLRGWWMDKRVGVGLVVLWTASTIGNVIAEVLGWEKKLT
ncbi:uncharacterized protein KY384_009047 [Bacidia gigantensis]|uniref:uncharacterized protein n=1 Tax=Bacidia gigantensis TaxID=2732470 RepID=UPI001D05AA6D|nr:uncharacterized protein KY384_009047 [Bacidia gigantensis]KAG8525403.1 hypothetical protein KY384_009047 [Bacidia gigantensis]